MPVTLFIGHPERLRDESADGSGQKDKTKEQEEKIASIFFPPLAEENTTAA